MGSSKSQKEACFQACQTKVGNSGFLHKTKLEGDPETLTFGFMQLFDLMQPQHLRACQYQFGGLDTWASYLVSLKPLGLRCCFV